MTRIDLPILRTSERRDFKRCPQRWWWAWREGLRPKKESFGPLWFGTGIHLGFEHWFVPGRVRGVDARVTFAKFVDDQVAHVKTRVADGDTGEETLARWVEAGELGKAMFDGYIKEYGHDEDWEVIAVEHPFQVTIPRPGTREGVVVYAGTFDLVARRISTGDIYLWDHKTAASIQVGHLPLDDQAGSYWALAGTVLRRAGLIGPKERIRGIVYNFLMKAEADERPRNEDGLACNKPKKEHYVAQLIGVDGWEEADLKKKKLEELESIAAANMLVVFGEVSKSQPAKRFHREVVLRTQRERRKQIERIGAEAVVMDLYRRGDLPLIKNPTKDCQWDCSYREMCELDENGGDVEEYKDMVFKQEDPYAAHRPQDEED